MSLTDDPNDPRIRRGGPDTERVPQNDVYLVLPEAERAKGFVRPFRDEYRHVGLGAPRYALRDLTPEERGRYGKYGYAKYEEYPQPSPDGSSSLGKFWTQAELDAVGKGCQTVTRMGRALSETYACDPYFYGATYCVTCAKHLPVAEFIWTADGQRVGS